MDLDDWGRMAQYSDPLGGQFAVWQPEANRGVELVDQPGSLCWTELYTSDAAAAKEFYGGIFGWQFSDMELPGGGGSYSLITPAGLPEERMHGGLMELPKENLALANGRPYWHPVFAVADCDAAVAKVTEISSTSAKSFEDAIQQGLNRASKTLRNVRSAWIKEHQVRCDGGRVTEYQVNMMVTFVLDE